jgi:hypothetical protein
LSFYAKEGGDKLGDVSLSSSSDVSLSGDREFAVTSGDGTKLFLEASDGATREAWVKAIMQNIVSLRSLA